jgi:hypothetical protein
MSPVDAQNWVGTFTMRNNCNSYLCCCRSGRMTTTQSGFYLVITSDLTGCTSTSSTSIFSYPYSYYAFRYTTTSGAIITYSLSYDSKTITLSNNLYSYCNDVADRITRSNANILHASFGLLFILFMLVSCWRLPWIQINNNLSICVNPNYFTDIQDII